MKDLFEVVGPEVKGQLDQVMQAHLGQPTFVAEFVAVLEPYREQIERECVPDDTGLEDMCRAIEQGLIRRAMEAAYAERKANQPKPPYRVHVRNGDQSEDLGEGVYTGDVPVYFIVMPDQTLRSLANAEEEPPADMVPEGAQVVKSDNNPRIELDSGQVVYGCQVWWEPVKENTET